MTEPIDAVGTAAAIAGGALTAVAAVTGALDRLAAVDTELNAFTFVRRDEALAEAAEVDAGTRRGPLAGVPISVKDHVWVKGLPATNGSRALASFVAPQTCLSVARLMEAGAIIVGKTNNPEFCYRGVTENELFGVTRNPRDTSRTTGGSSGGAAASVAAGVVPLAVGTDGGGSIRIPSAFCGVYGLKPTFGLVPTMPGFRGWPSVSVTGPIAASARDLALAVSVMSATEVARPTLVAGWAGLRVAASANLGFDGFVGVDPDVRAAFEAALEVISSDGAQITRAHPDVTDPAPLWDAVALPEGYASDGPLVEAHRDLVGADAAAIALAGRDITASAYLDAQYARSTYTAGWDAFFDDFDVLLTPTMPVTAFETGRLAPSFIDGQPVPASFDAWCALALPANLAGLPAASVPIGVGRDGLPVGMQVMGARGADALVVQVAALIGAHC